MSARVLNCPQCGAAVNFRTLHRSLRRVRALPFDDCPSRRQSRAHRRDGRAAAGPSARFKSERAASGMAVASKIVWAAPRRMGARQLERVVHRILRAATTGWLAEAQWLFMISFPHYGARGAARSGQDDYAVESSRHTRWPASGHVIDRQDQRLSRQRRRVAFRGAAGSSTPLEPADLTDEKRRALRQFELTDDVLIFSLGHFVDFFMNSS